VTSCPRDSVVNQPATQSTGAPRWCHRHGTQQSNVPVSFDTGDPHQRAFAFRDGESIAERILNALERQLAIPKQFARCFQVVRPRRTKCPAATNV